MLSKKTNISFENFIINNINIICIWIESCILIYKKKKKKDMILDIPSTCYINNIEKKSISYRKYWSINI